ncbi:Di-and tricarboxylate transporter [Saccharopolyspora antimicrobica]|uniref:Di-and tricarboxylate transporter n=1 Tax=Saccharopolyspora antimicrobica TaxID=455193 RepID=A0A1I5E6Y9_9PSEU|nr:SLC13 family permease [Saccharopolyspora antimicrobica]RKT86695.1 UIT1 family transporter [Saccharopolyspora antimicrobica]SFO07255.1 Di-and tricarboxylate transporter [Saccharopolyspora antimicrobica]
MSAAIATSVGCLVLMFAMAIAFNVNIGALGFVAALVVATVGGLSADQLLESFPADIFVLIAGVTYLFAIARENGTVELIIRTGVRLVAGKVALIPVVFGAIAALLVAFGVFPSAALALLAPLAMTFAAQYRVSPLLMGLIVLHGVNATAMSPLNSYGAVTQRVLSESGLTDVSIWSVFTLFLAMYLLLMTAVYFAFGGLRLIRHGHGAEPAVDGVGAEVTRSDVTGEQKVTLLAIAALVVLALGFGLDVGITAFGLGALLTLFFPKRADGAVRGISWSVILLTSGLFVFVGVAKEVGAIDYASNAIGSLGDPVLTTLLAFLVGGVVSAFASTTATLGATFPILIPPLQAADFPHIPGAVAGFGVAASVVDVSPTSPSGAMLMANVRNRDKQVYFRQLVFYAGAMLVTGSLVPWLLLVVLGLG